MAAPTSSVKPIIAVPFYSTYGHVATLAEEVIAGVEAAGGIAKPYFIEETLPAEVLEKMHAGASLKPKYPLLEPAHLTEVDGFIFGIPTRYGRAPAQVSAFFDKTGGLWASQALNGKYASTFTSTASQHGGQELTHMTTLPFFVHHGCIYVPIGYTQPYLSDNSEVHGASPWGTSTVANGDGSRLPTEGEKAVARYQGEHFTKIVAAAVRGRHLLAADAQAGTGAAVAGGAAAAGAGAAAVSGAARTEAPLARETGPAAPTAKDAVAGSASGTAAATPSMTPATTAKEAGTPAEKATTEAAVKPEAPAAVPAAGPAAAAGTKPVDAAARPTATAPQKKSGGLFSCCSGNSID